MRIITARTSWCLALLLTAFMWLPVNAESQTPFMTAEDVERYGGSRLFDAQGYRVGRYRSPTPDRIEGVKRVNTDQLETLMATEPDLLVFDVINLTFLKGRFRQEKPHQALPGAIWLPNTGQGNLASRWERYLLSEVAHSSGGDKHLPVVVACKSDCWLSWNVSLRLREAGYSNLHWYQDGVDTWAASGRRLVTVAPVIPEFALNTDGSAFDTQPEESTSL